MTFGALKYKTDLTFSCSLKLQKLVWLKLDSTVFMFLKIHTHTNYLSCWSIFEGVLNSMCVSLCVYSVGSTITGLSINLLSSPDDTSDLYREGPQCVHVHIPHTHTHTHTHICQWQTEPFNTLTLELSLSGSVSQHLNCFTALPAALISQNAFVESSEDLGRGGSECHIHLVYYAEL